MTDSDIPQRDEPDASLTGKSGSVGAVGGNPHGDPARNSGSWPPRFTPAHASWFDQAEILNNSFSDHYLRRGSWKSREEFIAHIASSWPEYNRLYAHPFEWIWTNQRMRRWFTEHALCISGITYGRRN